MTTLANQPANPPIFRLAGREVELPPGVAAILVSPVQPDEILPGESLAEAMARLRRAVVIRDEAEPA